MNPNRSEATKSNLVHIMNDIKQIAGNNNNPCIVYVGIGTYAGRVEIDENGNKYLSEEHYHQFPLALKELYIKYKNLQIFTILIDPFLEENLFMVNDINLSNSLQENVEWEKTVHNTVERYMSMGHRSNRLHVYTVRDSVIIQKEETINEDPSAYRYTDITENIRMIHKLCLDMNMLYLYHNFTGHSIRSIYDVFADEIKDDLNTIIYGLGNGYIDGCYYDLRPPNAKLAHVMLNDKKRPYLYVYNIDSIHKYNDIEMFFEDTHEMFGDEMLEIISAINTCMIDRFKFEFNNYIFSHLRHTYNEQIEIMKDGASPNTMYIHDYDLQPFNTIQSKYIKNLYSTRDVDIFEKMKALVSEHFKYIIKFILAQTQYNELTSHDIIEMITNDRKNVYTWSQVFKNIFN